MIAPKYLTDSLTPWYGAWTLSAGGSLSISYASLPPQSDILAKLVCDTPGGGYGSIQFLFNAPQNIGGTVLEFWHRCALNPTLNKYYYIQTPDSASYYKTFGAAVGNWLLFQIPMPDPTSLVSTGISKSRIACRMNKLVFDYGVAGAWTFEIAGLTFRRL